MGMNHTDADNALADALWWLRGFEAATTSDHDDTVRRLWTGLRAIRVWLNEAATGDHRLLGTTDRHRAVVITEAEFERMHDGLRGLTNEDRELGLSTSHAILAAFQREAVEIANASNPDIPF